MNKKLNTLVLFFFLSSTMISFAQTSFQYDANGNRTARIINLGKEVLADAAINDSLQGEPEPPKPLQEMLGEATVNVYPNPTQGLLILESQGFDMDKLPKYEVYTLSGSLLMRVEATENRQQIDLSDQPSGIYLLRTKSGSLQKEWKIIKQ